MDARRIILWGLKVYQRWVSPLFSPHCRFYPTCSSYARECFETLPLGQAFIKVCGRLGRCHPLHPGGVDLPHPREMR
ncbi:MAG: membrane protein insertion efficiency factor YidD [Deltaproteobacteria bacterium RIFCSPLOWO2_02_FULL_50_16]|nr:MAG: membrane protein insertion efficiency factor YidD [Deltaproteobacteria bacterium RIFCSPHIGHO2_02_FULL_50_15]OGQ56820.1 MAG: membrane protein insertion efficiency factor YidD [Deltaproteobacteria bacterium RIFCSPLOWO2_02_FULL_50_16]OGQ68275.1 MAG: membrane protein insertion efficiency factor YidD [Deltaproteobacteria bacterium RIFCSPLOWO2_12_FULL_50_11]